MANLAHATKQDRKDPKSFRTTARIVGALYLAGMVVGIGGFMLVQSVLTAPDPLPSIAASGMLIAVGAVLWLLTVVGDAAHGVLMFPVLKPHSERMAMAYFGARIVDGTFIAVMALLMVIQIPVGLAYSAAGSAEAASLEALSGVLTEANVYAYEFGMVAVGVAGLVLCSVLFRSRLVPRGLAVWGLVGYAVLLSGSILQVLGFELNSIQAVPGGLWEVFIGVWLIAKGFSSSSVPSAEPTSSTTTPTVPAKPLANATT